MPTASARPPAQQLSSRWDQRVLLVGVATVAAAPSLIDSVLHPMPLVDDWDFIDRVQHHQWDFGWSQRPGQALLHALTFIISGSHPVPPLVFLGALNGVIAAALFLVVFRAGGGERYAVLTSLIWGLEPNRVSTRLWASTIPNLFVALLLVLVALVLVRPHLDLRWTIVALALLTASCLTYEGGAAIAVGLLGVCIWRQPAERRVVVGAAGSGSLLASLIWIRAHTPKSLSSGYFHGWYRFVSAQVGAGMFPEPLARFTLPAMGVLVVAAFAGPRVGRCSGRSWDMVRIGAIVTVLGAAVFAATSFVLSMRGLFDRGSVYADLGSSLLLAGVVCVISDAVSSRGRRDLRPAMTLLLATVVLEIFTGQTILSLQAWSATYRDSRSILASTSHITAEPSRPFVIDGIPARQGVAAFAADYDLTAAETVINHRDLGTPTEAGGVYLPVPHFADARTYFFCANRRVLVVQGTPCAA